MTYTLEQFAADIRAALTDDAGRKGREAVARLVERVLRDENFLAEHAAPDAAAERRVLYEDSDLGFCICAHVYQGAKHGAPHDHGPTWAIYGQAAGETEMTDWRMVSPPADGNPGKVEQVRKYTMRPGDAHLYDPGDIHAPERTAPTRLIRIEGENTDRVERTALEAV